MSEERERTCCCEARKKVRTQDEQRALLNRLSRIEGQIRGLRGMVEKDAYCPDILNQSAAAAAALNAFNRELLASHMKTCVVSDIQEGKDGTMDALLDTIYRLMR